MRKIYNERHVAKEERASDLDILKELDKRTELAGEYAAEFARLEAKEKGLEKLLATIDKYADEHWLYLTDLALDYYETITCDLLLITDAGVYPFEVNHYEGVFTVEEKEAYLDGYLLPQNPIEDASTMSSQLQSIALMNDVHLNVQGAAIFTGTENGVIIEDETPRIDIVTSDQLDHYLEKIALADEHCDKIPMTTPKHLRWFGQIDRHFPIQQIKIPSELYTALHRGIVCCHCGNFNVKIGNPYISCNCGMHESLEEATVRTICEYGVLNNDKQLEVSELLDFFDYQISEDILYEYLDKHFTPAF